MSIETSKTTTIRGYVVEQWATVESMAAERIVMQNWLDNADIDKEAKGKFQKLMDDTNNDSWFCHYSGKSYQSAKWEYEKLCKQLPDNIYRIKKADIAISEEGYRQGYSIVE